MNPGPHEFVTVDMRGIKAALVVRARADKVSVSAIVRAAVAAWIGIEESPPMPEEMATPVRQVKLSLRFTEAQANRLRAAAQSAGMSRAAYLSYLVDGIPVFLGDADYGAHRRALVASNAELAGLLRSSHRLSALAHRDSGLPPRDGVAVFDDLVAEVRRHLRVAGRVLSDLRPRKPASGSIEERGHGTRR